MSVKNAGSSFLAPSLRHRSARPQIISWDRGKGRIPQRKTIRPHFLFRSERISFNIIPSLCPSIRAPRRNSRLRGTDRGRVHASLRCLCAAADGPLIRFIFPNHVEKSMGQYVPAGPAFVGYVAHYPSFDLWLVPMSTSESRQDETMPGIFSHAPGRRSEAGTRCTRDGEARHGGVARKFSTSPTPGGSCRGRQDRGIFFFSRPRAAPSLTSALVQPDSNKLSATYTKKNTNSTQPNHSI